MLPPPFYGSTKLTTRARVNEPNLGQAMTASNAPHLLVSTQERIIIATLNRPEKLNALSDEMMQAFEETLLRFRDTSELKVMLIRATGRYFCAGADLRQGDPGSTPRTGSAYRENLRIKNRNMHRIYDEMEHIEKPIVVAHHAMCVGGGLDVALL